MSFHIQDIQIKSITKHFALMLIISFVFSLFVQQDSRAHTDEHNTLKNCRVLIADRVFDGFNLHENTAVLFKNKRIVEVGTPDELSRRCTKKLDLGDATILPGFIESHAHISFQNISGETVLKHGVTTVRDTGGPLHKPIGGNGKLRLLSAGPIIQPHDGYPLNIFAQGHDDTGHHGKYEELVCQ